MHPLPYRSTRIFWLVVNFDDHAVSVTLRTTYYNARLPVAARIMILEVEDLETVPFERMSKSKRSCLGLPTRLSFKAFKPNCLNVFALVDIQPLTPQPPVWISEKGTRC